MTTELIPVVDLRYLSQAELNTLSLSSANAFDVRRCDDIVVPKIDRSVFNESAGSRKQTYTRIGLAQRKPDARSSPSSSRRSRPLPTSSPSPASAVVDDEAGRLENQKIVSFLTQLFSGEKPSIATTPPAPSPVQSLALVLADRPNSSIKSEEASWSLVSVNDMDKEVLNGKGMVVDLVALGKKDDAFGEELRRRTEGMKLEPELLEFLGGLDGQWGSRRRKRKIVDAATFGDDLPRGWKLLLGLRRKEGIVRLESRRYISPSGKQFASCKEVSSYILSVIGNQDPGQPISAENCGGIPNIDKMTPQSSAGPTSQTDATKETRSCIVVKPISSTSAVHEKQHVLFNAEQIAAEPKNVLECHKCSLTLNDKDALVQHLLSFHQRSAKRRKLGKSIGDGVIVKDGKYECQICHKTFIGRHRCNGHIGAHVRYQGVSVETVPDGSISGDAINPTPLAALSPGQLNLDSMAYEASNQIDLCSCTMISDIEKYSEEPKVDSESNMLTVSANGLSCSAGTYSNDIFSGKMEGDIVQIDTSSDVGHCHVLPDKGGVIGDTLNSELYGSQKSPVGSRHTSSVTVKADSTFLNDIKVTVLDEMDKIGNELENCFHSFNTEGDAGDVIENDKSSLLVDVANAPWVQSSHSLPILDMITNQCEAELDGVVQKLENMSGYQELMMNTQLPEFVLLNDEELGSVHKSTNKFGYVAELENENCLPIEPGWGLSMPEMVDQRKLKTACAWCSNEFYLEDISAELPSDIVRSVCPACKGNISGQANVARNGLSGQNSQL